MPSQETIILVMLAGFTLSASPGPSMLYVLSRSIGQDRSAVREAVLSQVPVLGS